MVQGQARIQVRSQKRDSAETRRSATAGHGFADLQPAVHEQQQRANTGNALATFLLGEVNAGSVQTVRSHYDPRRVCRLLMLRMTGGDRRLTLNYGLRYDLEFPRRKSTTG